MINQSLEQQIKEARIKRLSINLVNLIDLKVKGIITEHEYKQRKRQLLGF